MSDANNASPPREWRFYLDDMIGFAERVLSYTDGLDQKSFDASRLNYDATLRNLELIGEAATHIPAPVREGAPQVPWRQIIATRTPHPRLPGHRQRYVVEHHSDRRARFAAATHRP